MTGRFSRQPQCDVNSRSNSGVVKPLPIRLPIDEAFFADSGNNEAPSHHTAKSTGLTGQQKPAKTAHLSTLKFAQTPKLSYGICVEFDVSVDRVGLRPKTPLFSRI